MGQTSVINACDWQEMSSNGNTFALMLSAVTLLHLFIVSDILDFYVKYLVKKTEVISVFNKISITIVLDDGLIWNNNIFVAGL